MEEAQALARNFSQAKGGRPGPGSWCEVLRLSAARYVCPFARSARLSAVRHATGGANKKRPAPGGVAGMVMFGE